MERGRIGDPSGVEIRQPRVTSLRITVGCFDTFEGRQQLMHRPKDRSGLVASTEKGPMPVE